MTTKAIEAGATRLAEKLERIIKQMERTGDWRLAASEEQTILDASRMLAAIASGELAPASAVAAEREWCAKAVSNMTWTLPLYAPEENINVATGEAANIVIRQATDLLRALSPEPASGEVVVVPRVPTQAMIEAGEETFTSCYSGTPVSTPQAVWTAMLNAATKDGEQK